MCIGVPGKIISLNEYNAIVSVMGVEMEAFIGLIENPQVGDNILIHAGCAIQKIADEHYDYLKRVFYNILEEE